MNRQNVKTILLVEDDKITSMAISREIADFGYKIIVSDNGSDAVDIATQNRNISLILMDIDLGKGIDGTEAARQILEKREIPIIFHTSHTEEEFVSKVKEITRYGYVVKNSGSFVLKSSIEMAFELFETNQTLQNNKEELERAYEEIQASNEELLTTNEELINTQNELLLSETMYRELFNNISSGVAIYKVIDGGNDFIFKDINKTGELSVNDKKEYLIGKSVYEVKSGIKEFGLDEVFKRVSKTGIPEYYPVKLYEDNKINRFYENFVYQLPSGDIVAVFDDISEKKIREMELQKLNENLIGIKESIVNERNFLKAVLGTTQDGFVVLNNEGKITDVNRSYCNMTGYSYEELTNMSISDIDQFENPEVTNIRIERIIKNGFENFEVIQRRKDGTLFYVEISASIVNIGETALICFCRDITERKKAENNIKLLLSEKEQILGEVHHRIKNNLNVIISILKLHLRTITNEDAILSIKETINRIQTSLVLYEKLYTQKKFLQISVRNYFIDLIDEIITLFPNYLSIKVIKEIDDFIIDGKILFSLGIIVNELVTNAMKYAFHNIENGSLTISIKKRDHIITMIVKDNGAGISESINVDDISNFGLSLIRVLSQQIKGEFRIEREEGTKCIVEFQYDE